MLIMKRNGLRLLTCFSLFLLFYMQTKASDLIEVLPVSSNVLMLHFDDGHIDLYGEGGEWWQGLDNVVYHAALNTTNATTAINYTITSPDDINWGTVKPTQVGRKSKGVDFQLNNGTPLYVSEHWIYLVLPKTLVSGRSYTVSVGALADNMDEYTFVFNEKELRSETVRVNQCGFAPHAKKIAYLSHWMGSAGNLNLNHMDGKPFHLVRYSDKKVVYTGEINFRQENDRTILRVVNNNPANITGPYKNHTHADIAECNFSDFSQPGEYVISVPGIGCSFPFEISDGAVNQPFYTAMKGLFYQRQGIVKELPDGNIYPRDHHPDDIKLFYVPNDVTNSHNNYKSSWVSTGLTQVYDIWGYYHDASDWDCYSGHYRIPVLLMLLYNMYPDKFYDGEISNRYKLHEDDAQWIDEGNNGIPDLLDEAAWLVHFGKRSRHALMDQELGTGGCPGYIGREGGAGGGLKGSWQDTRDWAVTTENPVHTMAYAAVASLYALSLNAFHHLTHPAENHPEYQMWIDEAISAYAWAVAHGGTDAENGEGGMWTIAAFNLYRATGQTAYKDAVTAHYGQNDNSSWHTEAANNPTGYLAATLIYLFPEVSVDAAVYNWARGKVQSQAQSVLARNENIGFRYGAYDEETYELGMFSTPKVMMMAAEHRMGGNDDYLGGVQDQMSYVLGGNQLNTVHITMLGERPQNKGIHHIDSWVLNDPDSKVYSWEPVPGVVSYFGSNISWVTGPGDHHLTIASAYPIHDESPRSEMNFGNRESINGSEFTTMQTMSSWAYTSGYLKAVYGSNPEHSGHNPRPVVSIELTPNQNIAKDGVHTLTAAASSDTRIVKYYYDWHYIGQSTDTAHQFAFPWNVAECNLQTGNKPLITAVAFDNHGLITRPTAQGEIQVNIVAGSGTGATGILVSPDSKTLDVDQVLQLTATVSPSTASDKTVIWTSDKPLVASVNDKGVVTALSSGTAKITATSQSGKHKAVVTVTVTNIPVSDISITPSVSTLNIGSTLSLNAEVLPANAANKSVTWKSGNEAVATVSPDGVVTAHAGGEVTITATSSDANIHAEAQVTVNPPVEGVFRYLKVTFLTGNNLEMTEIELFVGTTQYPQTPYEGTAGNNLFDLCTTATNDCKKYYGSTFPFVATVDLGAGSAIRPDKIKLYKRTWSTLNSFKIEGSNNNTDWTLIGQFEGITNTNFTGADPHVGEFSVPGSTIAVSGVTVSHSELEIVNGKTATITATVSPANASNKAVSWTSDNESVATVDENGLITTHAVGTATITATTADGSKTATCELSSVNAPVAVTGISLSQEAATLDPEEEITLSASLQPSNATNQVIIWRSDNPEVATVDQSGKITALKSGAASISVTTYEGAFTAVCDITVNAIAVSGLSVSPTTAALTLGQTTTLIPTVSPDDAANKEVSWESDNETVATVDQTGEVTAVSPGSAVITATTADGGYTASASITVNPLNNAVNRLSDQQLYLWPNPVADGQLKLNIPNPAGDSRLALNMYDITGKCVLSQTIESTGNQVHTIDCSSLEAGLYLLRIEGQGISVCLKTVIAR